MNIKKAIATATTSALLFGSMAFPALAAKPPGAQVFSVYDETYDGLQVGTDSDIGNVEATANPGGQGRLIVNVHVQKAAPNCELSVELVRATGASNGGLDSSGHTGSIQVLGTLTTNGVGNGNAHFDIPVGDGVLDTQMWGHIDLEDYGAACTEADGTNVQPNEYGAAPDPSLVTPFTWME